jgi:hypothetical protein
MRCGTSLPLGAPSAKPPAGDRVPRVQDRADHGLRGPQRPALAYLQGEIGGSRSQAARQAILDAERAHRRARLRAEAEAIREDPEDRAAARALAEEMAGLFAW